jgi:hypothetical protein
MIAATRMLKNTPAFEAILKKLSNNTPLTQKGLKSWKGHNLVFRIKRFAATWAQIISNVGKN